MPQCGNRNGISTWAGLAVLLAVTVGTSMAYHALRPEWVAYRGARALQAEGRHGDAAAVYARLEQSGFAPPMLLFHLADALVITGDAAGAARRAEAYLAKAEPAKWTYVRAGGVLARARRFPRAAELYRRALELDPTDRTLRWHHARLLTAQGAFDDAAVELRRLLGEQR